MGRPPKERTEVESEELGTISPEPETPQEQQNNIPEEFKGAKFKNFKEYIETKLTQMTELATLEHKLPLHTRIRNRLNSIKKMSQAEHIKIENHWMTKPPQIHICSLEARKISNDLAEVRFKVFKHDENGNKVVHVHKAKEYSPVHEKEIERVTSASYVIDYEVKEILKRGEPIKREIMRYENPEQALKR